MISFLLLFFIISHVDANTCSCLLGYRNGAQSTDQNLCMGPAEGGERPCYPTPCNSDWTPCTTVSNDNSCPSWEKVSSHLGKKPDCEKVIVNNGHNYLWGTLEQCKNKCLSESSGKCNIVSRYSGKNDNENYHCRFYGCKDLNNFNWIDQNEWGNGASGCVTYKLGCNLDEDICRTCPWMENTCDPINRYINITQYVNQTRYINVTRYVDTPRYINTTRFIDTPRYVDTPRYINTTRFIDTPRYIDIPRYINTTRYINVTRYVDIPKYINTSKYVNVTRYVDTPRYINTTRYINVTRYVDTHRYINTTRYINVTRYVDIPKYINTSRYVNVTRYVDIPKYINTSRYVNVTRYFNQTLYINQTRYHDIINYINRTLYINQTRYHDIINYINRTLYINQTQYRDIINYINRTKINNSDITFKIVYKNNNTSPSSPQTAISDHSNNYDRNVNKTDLKKYISLFNLSRTEIILIIIIIILMIHCIFRETYFGKYCNIRCICLRAFSYDKEENIKYSSKNIHIQLPQREKIEI